MTEYLEVVLAADSLKGTGFTPYMKAVKSAWALAPEGFLFYDSQSLSG
jgi:hypothetical protein